MRTYDGYVLAALNDGGFVHRWFSDLDDALDVLGRLATIGSKAAWTILPVREVYGTEGLNVPHTQPAGELAWPSHNHLTVYYRRVLGTNWVGHLVHDPRRAGRWITAHVVSEAVSEVVV